MTKQDLRIVYMGTPEFAVASLRALVENGYNVVAVVTMPDKPAGRGHQLQYSDVKKYALSVGLPVLQPEKLKDPAFVEELRSYRADLQIVVAFRMLPEVVWTMPALGTFNLHGSLLPKYRGAAPINWAVINGDKETGVTTFFLKHDIDTGDLILQERMPIGEDENVGSVHDRMMVLGAGLVTRTVDLIIDSVNTGQPVPTKSQNEVLSREQIPAEALGAPKIFKETCEIDLTRTAREVKNFVRGLSPYPAAWTNLRIGDHVFENTKIFEVRLSPAGSPSTLDSRSLSLKAADGYLDILSLQVPGKKRMNAKDFLNGLH